MTTTTCEHVDISVDAKVMRIKLNRPDKKNAISRAMYAAMADAVVASNTDSSVRVVMFEGTEGCFTSGNDLKDFMVEPDIGTESPAGRFLGAVPQAQKPVVAAVTGMAVGIGTTLLLHCDLAYAAKSAKFHTPFVNLGLVPEFGSSYLLPQLAGPRRASELLMLGQPFDAEHAKALGIINDVVADEKVVEFTLEKAQALAAQPPSALRRTKELLRRHSLDAIMDQMKAEVDHFGHSLTSPEAAEAFTAFMEKRKPDFSKFD
jgi:enoyl-CoA hydratase/carnithine racemase